MAVLSLQLSQDPVQSNPCLHRMMPIAGPMLEEPSQLVEVAKCNLGEVNLELMQANPISCQSQANTSRDL